MLLCLLFLFGEHLACENFRAVWRKAMALKDVF
jgi:hypothetical protein